MADRQVDLRQAYDRMLASIGPQSWWPAETRVEMMVGAILVQNTSWRNVARSIDQLRGRGLLTARQLADADPHLLAQLITPSGFMTAKGPALQRLARWILDHGPEESSHSELDDTALRASLLALRGIGPETADVLMLYAFDRAVFVADSYARRLYEALGSPAPNGYTKFRALGTADCARAGFTLLEHQELHALIDEFGNRVSRGTHRYEQVT
ncbi:endonuclease III domain-containing protein [Pseudoclavibacter helvolus]|uniref:endonuclease III domain-containing protein n=1 Tax=Pseudoclavibacter helvolus TaxID=255205 RepID=UPI003C72A95C